jgi:hypothetical protein
MAIKARVRNRKTTRLVPARVGARLGMSGRSWWWAAGFNDDRTGQRVGGTAHVGAGGDHDDDRSGKERVESGEGVAKADGVRVVPGPEDRLDLPGLSGLVPDTGNDGRRRGEDRHRLGWSDNGVMK